MAAAIVCSLLLTREAAPAQAAAQPSVRRDVTADVRGPLPERPRQAAALALQPASPDRVPEVAEPASVTSPPSGSAVVRGRLLDQDDVGVPSAVVSLYRGATRVDATTDAAGAFEFPGLPPGLYRAIVPPDALPEGLLAPGQNPGGRFAAAFRLTAGAEQDIVLRAFAAGSVSGRVVGAAGEPLSGAVVGVRSPSGITGEARTDASGRYTIAALRPGTYTTSVRLDPSRPDADASAPLPAAFELAPREDRALPDLVACSSGHVLRGTVVDGAGRPVAGLTITCREDGAAGSRGEWQRETDAEGRYAIGRVPAGILLLAVDDAELRAGRLREPVEPLRVEVPAEAGVIDVAPIQVEARRPFRVVGRVRVDADWAGLGRWKARVLVRALDAPADEEQELPVGPTGDFDWSCETPHADVELVVIVHGTSGREVERRERVQPVADEARELVVTVP